MNYVCSETGATVTTLRQIFDHTAINQMTSRMKQNYYKAFEQYQFKKKAHTFKNITWNLNKIKKIDFPLQQHHCHISSRPSEKSFKTLSRKRD